MGMRWEADDLATQVERAGERFAEVGRGTIEEALSPAERAQRARLSSLSMSHTRTLYLHSRATNPAHREMLERALRFLENEMCKP